MHVDSGDSTGVELDFELNLAPIIDCFTVLITFLLISASYLSIHVIEASVASVEVSQEPAPADAKPSISLTVRARVDGGYDVLLSGGETQAIPVPPGPDSLSLLEKNLVDVLAKWKETKVMTLFGEENVEYKDIVRVMEMARNHFPSILLGGF